MTTRLASVRLLVEDELSRLPADSFFFSAQLCTILFGRSASIADINNERSVFSDRNSDARQAFYRLSPCKTLFERTLVSTMCHRYIHRTIRVRRRRLFLEEKARAINSTLLEVGIECRCKTSSQFVRRPCERGAAALSKNACRPLSTRGEEAKEKKGWPAIISPSVVASYLRRGCNGRNVRRLANIGLDRIGGRKSTLLRESGSEQLPPRDEPTRQT